MCPELQHLSLAHFPRSADSLCLAANWMERVTIEFSGIPFVVVKQANRQTNVRQVVFSVL